MYAPPQTPPDAEARAEAAAKPAAAAHATVQPPALPPVIRCAYDLSCFSYLLVAAALWAHGARGTIPGRMLAFMLPAQAAISFLAARKTALAFEAAISSAVRLASIPFSRRSSTRAALRFRRERFLASLASALACASFFRA